MAQVASADVVLTIPSEPASEDEQAAADEPFQGGGIAAVSSRCEGAEEQSRGWEASLAAESAREDGVAAVSSTALPARHDSRAQVLEPRDEENREWEVRVTKDGDEVGIDVLQHEKDSLRVTNIKAGPILLWNQQNPDQALRPGDRIVSVNGERGDSEQLIGAVRAAQELCLGMRRILWLRVELWKDEGPLGIDVSSHSRSLKILKIRPGPFTTWNSKASTDHRVCENDQIVEVNGVTGEADDLLQAIRVSGNQINLLLSVSGRSQSHGAHRSHGIPRPMPPPANGIQGAPTCDESMTLEEVHDGRNEPPAGHTALTIT